VLAKCHLNFNHAIHISFEHKHNYNVLYTYTPTQFKLQVFHCIHCNYVYGKQRRSSCNHLHKQASDVTYTVLHHVHQRVVAFTSFFLWAFLLLFVTLLDQQRTCLCCCTTNQSAHVFFLWSLLLEQTSLLLVQDFETQNVTMSPTISRNELQLNIRIVFDKKYVRGNSFWNTCVSQRDKHE
jgi:hypothetical protein